MDSHLNNNRKMQNEMDDLYQIVGSNPYERTAFLCQFNDNTSLENKGNIFVTISIILPF